MDDPIGLGQYRGGGHRRSLVEPGKVALLDRLGLFPVDIFEQARGIGVAAIVVDRAAERDHLAHRFGMQLAEFAREHAAQAPPDDRDLAATLAVNFKQQRFHVVNALQIDPDVAAQVPAVTGITQIIEQPPHRFGRSVGGHEPGQDQHRMPVALGQHAEDRTAGDERCQFEHRADLGQCKQPVRRTGFDFKRVARSGGCSHFLAAFRVLAVVFFLPAGFVFAAGLTG